MYGTQDIVFNAISLGRAVYGAQEILFIYWLIGISLIEYDS